MADSKEIELKLRIEDAAEMDRRLLALGAQARGTVEQTDRLYETPSIDFRADNQALRLRTEVGPDCSRSILTYKGSPRHTTEGHKVRDEFETVVDDWQQADLLLKAIRFANSETIIKTRASYELAGVHVAVDTLKFGTFIELEGAPEAIEELRLKLDLADAEPVKEGYIFLQWDWEAAHPQGA